MVLASRDEGRCAAHDSSRYQARPLTTYIFLSDRTKGRIEISRKDASESGVEDKMFVFDSTNARRCICETHPIVTLVSRTDAVGCPPVQLTIRNNSCPIHNEQWRRGYLGLPA